MLYEDLKEVKEKGMLGAMEAGNVYSPNQNIRNYERMVVAQSREIHNAESSNISNEKMSKLLSKMMKKRNKAIKKCYTSVKTDEVVGVREKTGLFGKKKEITIYKYNNIPTDAEFISNIEKKRVGIESITM